MYVGDWTSCYLALQNDVDPGPIDAIFALKDAAGARCRSQPSPRFTRSWNTSGRA